MKCVNLFSVKTIRKFPTKILPIKYQSYGMMHHRALKMEKIVQIEVILTSV